MVVDIRALGSKSRHVDGDGFKLSNGTSVLLDDHWQRMRSDVKVCLVWIEDACAEACPHTGKMQAEMLLTNHGSDPTTLAACVKDRGLALREEILSLA